MQHVVYHNNMFYIIYHKPYNLSDWSDLKHNQTGWNRPYIGPTLLTQQVLLDTPPHNMKMSWKCHIHKTLVWWCTSVCHRASPGQTMCSLLRFYFDPVKLIYCHSRLVKHIVKICLNDAIQISYFSWKIMVIISCILYAAWLPIIGFEPYMF